jgi:hypothetical protein
MNTDGTRIFEDIVEALAAASALEVDPFDKLRAGSAAVTPL